MNRIRWESFLQYFYERDWILLGKKNPVQVELSWIFDFWKDLIDINLMVTFFFQCVLTSIHIYINIQKRVIWSHLSFEKYQYLCHYAAKKRITSISVQNNLLDQFSSVGSWVWSDLYASFSKNVSIDVKQGKESYHWTSFQDNLLKINSLFYDSFS